MKKKFSPATAVIFGTLFLFSLGGCKEDQEFDQDVSQKLAAGTMSTETGDPYDAEASLSGYRVRKNKEEKQKQEEVWEPTTEAEASGVEFTPGDPGVKRVPTPKEEDSP